MTLFFIGLVVSMTHLASAASNSDQSTFDSVRSVVLDLWPIALFLGLLFLSRIIDRWKDARRTKRWVPTSSTDYDEPEDVPPDVAARKRVAEIARVTPASELIDLTPIERFIGMSAPDSIVWIYGNAPIATKEADVMRVMAPNDAVSATQTIRKFTPLSTDLLLLWTDDNSNYAGAYVTGPLAHRVALIDHEDPEDTPQFFSVESFEAARRVGMTANTAWYEFVTDYPVTADWDYASRLSDQELAMKYLESYRKDPHTRRNHVFYALNLLPPSETALLVPLLWTDDMWVQARVCEVLGCRRYRPAIDQLAKVATDGLHNGKIAAIAALRRMRCPEAHHKLEELKRKMGEGFGPHFGY